VEANLSGEIEIEIEPGDRGMGMLKLVERTWV